MSGKPVVSSGDGFNDRDTLQLKGIFLSLDLDKDGFLNRNQVRQAIMQVGIAPSEHTIESFFVDGRDKVDFSTFRTVLFQERDSLAEIGGQLDVLFSFIDSENTGYISSKELEHLLCGSSKVQFTKKDFQSFVNVLALDNKSGKYNIADVKQRLLFGSRS